MRVAVVGATGQVGTVMRSVLAERDVSRSTRSGSWPRRVRPGRRLEWEGTDSSSRTPRRPTTPARPRAHGRGQGDLAGVGAADGRGRRDRDRQLVGLADGPGRAARRARGERRRARPDPEGDRRQPELHDDGRDAGALAASTSAAGLQRVVVATYQAVSGAGLAGVSELDEQVAKTADGAAALTSRARPSSSRRTTRLRRADRAQRRALSPAPSSTTAQARPTRSRSSATRAARSSASRTCRRLHLRPRPGVLRPQLSIAVELDRALSPSEATEISPTAPGVVLDRRADPAQGRRRRRLARRADPQRPDRRRTAFALRLGRQPEQGRGAERRPDRRSASRGRSAGILRDLVRVPVSDRRAG